MNSGVPIPASHDGSAGASGPDRACRPPRRWDRKVIYNASVTWKWRITAPQDRNVQPGAAVGGISAELQRDSDRYELGGNFVIKVPSQGFQSFVRDLEKLAKKPVRGAGAASGARTLPKSMWTRRRGSRRSRRWKKRLLSFMEKATKTENLLQYSNELARVQENIETIKGRMRYLDQNVAFSTVELRIYQRSGSREPEKSDLSVAQRAGKAMKDSWLAILALFEGLVVLFAAERCRFCSSWPSCLIACYWMLVPRSRAPKGGGPVIGARRPDLLHQN